MIQPIEKDTFFLSQPSAEAIAEDVAVADDLLDTLKAHAEECVGMAANMIGKNKRIIAFSDKGILYEMFNPIIIGREQPFEAEEGCLSLAGVRKVKRYRKIKILWMTRTFKPRVKNFEGWTAQIIQHEMDHLEGILI